MEQAGLEMQEVDASHYEANVRWWYEVSGREGMTYDIGGTGVHLAQPPSSTITNGESRELMGLLVVSTHGDPVLQKLAWYKRWPAGRMPSVKTKPGSKPAWQPWQRTNDTIHLLAL